MLVYISFLFLSTSVGAMGSVCPSDVSMSSLTAGCISSSFLHMDSDRQVKVGGEGGASTCLAACLAVYPRQSSLGLAVRWEGPGEEGVVCGCLDHLPQQDKIGPQVFCNLTCEGQPCGGQQRGDEEYYSLYCRQGEGLTGVQLPEAWIQDSSEKPMVRPEAEVTMAMLLQEVNGLNSIAVILACLLCIIIVFIMLIIVYLYLKKQDKKLFKSNQKTIETLNTKLFTEEGTNYGSHNLAYENDEDDEVFHNGGPEVVKKGRSKFYNLESESPLSESREGKSKFYRQSGMDIKTPSPAEDEGMFQDIFSGSKSEEDDLDESEHPK